MASEPLRVIGSAYCDIHISQWNNNFTEEGENNHRFDQALDENVFDFKFLSVIAMKDPLRNKVKSAIKFAKEQGAL